MASFSGAKLSRTPGRWFGRILSSGPTNIHGHLKTLAVGLPHASGNRPRPRGVKAIMRCPVISRRAFLLAGTICRGLALPEDGEASPFLEVPKQLYALGEVVFFWVGVKTSGVVPRGTWSPGVLHIIRPDGTRESQKIGGPIDGDPTRGWRGGASLGRSPVMPGLYRLSFEWGQKQSPEAQLIVLEWDLRDRVFAHWVFQGSDLPHSSVTLEVKNQTDQLLRFIRLGAMGSHVWVHSTQGGPSPSHEATFYPSDLLFTPEPDAPVVAAEEARWEDLNLLPIVRIEPYGRYWQTLYPGNVKFDFPVTDPEIVFGTTLTLFLGEKNDPMSALYPVRLPVQGSHRFS